MTNIAQDNYDLFRFQFILIMKSSYQVDDSVCKTRVVVEPKNELHRIRADLAAVFRVQNAGVGVARKDGTRAISGLGRKKPHN